MNYTRSLLLVLCIITTTTYSNTDQAIDTTSRGRIYSPGTEADFQKMIDNNELLWLIFMRIGATHAAKWIK